MLNWLLGWYQKKPSNTKSVFDGDFPVSLFKRLLDINTNVDMILMNIIF